MSFESILNYYYLINKKNFKNDNLVIPDKRKHLSDRFLQFFRNLQRRTPLECPLGWCHARHKVVSKTRNRLITKNNIKIENNKKLFYDRIDGRREPYFGCRIGPAAMWSFRTAFWIQNLFTKIESWNTKFLFNRQKYNLL